MKLIRNVFFRLLHALKIGDFLLYRNRKRQKIPILVFHKIIPEYDEIWPGLHPRLFDEMIVMLKKHYDIMPLNCLYSGNCGDLSRACFITFDDGYKDFLDYAYPILKKHKAHSTLFVLPYDLSNHGHIWTSTIIYFVKHYWFEEVKEFFLQHNQRIVFDNPYNDFRLNLAITQHLCRLQQTEREVIIRHLQEKFVYDNRIIEKELLNFDELKKLEPAYTNVASHSLTHPSFALETDIGFIEYEIKESKNIIENNLGTSVSAFAFPFAKFNALSLSTVKKYYELCFTRINEAVDLKTLKSDPDYRFDLPRFNIHHDTPEEVFLLINGFHNLFKRQTLS